MLELILILHCYSNCVIYTWGWKKKHLNKNTNNKKKYSKDFPWRHRCFFLSFIYVNPFLKNSNSYSRCRISD